jgi:ankyrin repeat protein
MAECGRPSSCVDAHRALRSIIPCPNERALRTQDLRRTEIVKALVHAGADVNAADASGITPLLANTERRTDVALLLLSLGANPCVADHSGRTPLHVAAARGDAKLVAALLGKSTDVGGTDARPPVVASSSTSAAGASALPPPTRVPVTAAMQAAMLRALDADGRTPEDAAIVHQHQRIAAFLQAAADEAAAASDDDEGGY